MNCGHPGRAVWRVHLPKSAADSASDGWFRRRQFRMSTVRLRGKDRIKRLGETIPGLNGRQLPGRLARRQRC